MSDLWSDIYPDSDSSDSGSSDEGIKYHENQYYQEQEEVVSVLSRKPRRLRRGDQRSLWHLKSDIEISNDNLSLIKHIPEGLAQAKWYFLQVYMDNSYHVAVKEYGAYRFWWHIRQYDECTKHPAMECCFWTEIITNNQDDTIGNMLLVIPSKVHNLLKNNLTYVWYQDEISMQEHRLSIPFQFVTTGRKKLKYPDIIEETQWKE